MAELVLYLPHWRASLMTIQGIVPAYFPSPLKDVIPGSQTPRFHPFTIDPDASEARNREVLAETANELLTQLAADANLLREAQENLERHVAPASTGIPASYALLAKHYGEVKRYFESATKFYTSQLEAYEAAEEAGTVDEFTARAEEGEAVPAAQPHATLAKVIASSLRDDLKLPELITKKPQLFLNHSESYGYSARNAQEAATAAGKLAAYYASPDSVTADPWHADVRKPFQDAGVVDGWRRQFVDQLKSFEGTTAALREFRGRLEADVASALDYLQGEQLRVLQECEPVISAVRYPSTRLDILKGPLTDLLRQSAHPDGARLSADTVRQNPRIFELAMSAGGASLHDAVSIPSHGGSPRPYPGTDDSLRLVVYCAVAVARATETDETSDAIFTRAIGDFHASLRVGADLGHQAAERLNGREPDSPSAVLRRYQQAGRGPAARTAQTMPGGFSSGGPDRPSRKI